MTWKDFVSIHNNLSPNEEIACVLWTRPDVTSLITRDYPELYIAEDSENAIDIADSVLYDVNRHSDCEYGITWCHLEQALEEDLREREMIE